MAVSRVRSGTTCCVSLISCTTPHFLVATFAAILFFPQESNLKCRKSQESSSLGLPLVKGKACCLVSRQCVSVGQDYSSNPKSPGSTRDSQVWPWKDMKNSDGILFSMPRETESIVQKILEVSQRRAPWGNREYTRKSHSEHQRPTQTR